MTSQSPQQLVSYIAPAAPATRRPARGDEAFLRPEIGFTPKWYRKSLGIDFSKAWHVRPEVRCETSLSMVRELKRRFGNRPIGRYGDSDDPPDLLTGVFGACTVAAIYGVPIFYSVDNWPNCEHQYFSAKQIDSLEPPDLERNPFFSALLEQLEWIATETGRIEGYVNWQGVLNNAFRLRGEELFVDMLLEPERASRLFDCVATTIIEAARRVYGRQQRSGVEITHFTVSNCLVNMVSPEQYENLLFPFDKRIAESFDSIGVHNCAWNADGYLEHYARLPGVSYIDMGIDSNILRARKLFPGARRALMVTPMDLANKAIGAIEKDLKRVARDYGPCDIVFADIEAGTPDERVVDILDLCERISASYSAEA